ncbi:aromatic prenyltransferase [Nocardia aurantia]|uniref:Furaquinocin biosynthesis prenyltransferase n=1 Tax=Nocardia aurantia TaxID=2585199 RepID=A0A7K0DYU4_9NOCA|nr:aromatic prenyltransferase [Nocardia aurantia]MQY30718.1 Furaquinocin biosynthesis prenyltransferase [Nocardia aurantia]
MSGSAVTTLDRLRADLRTYAGLCEAPYDAAVVDPVLETLADAWTNSVVGVRTTTHAVPDREVNARVQYPGPAPELIERLRAAEFLEYVGHPMESLLDAILGMPVAGAVDLALGRGVQKVWFVLGRTLPVAEALALPGIPDAARGHADHLERYGGQVGIVALDFPARTMNLYSQVLTPEVITAADITTMLADLGLVPATEAELALFAGTFNVYRTFSWDAAHTVRVCFPRRVEAGTLPGDLDPVLAAFATGPVAAPERRHTVYAAYGPADRYYKIQTEYTSTLGAAFPGGTAPQIR